jgi:hypothetical protein
MLFSQKLYFLTKIYNMSLFGGRRRKSRKAGNRAFQRALVPLGFMALSMNRSKKNRGRKGRGTRKGMRRKTARKAYMKKK